MRGWSPRRRRHRQRRYALLGACGLAVALVGGLLLTWTVSSGSTFPAASTSGTASPAPGGPPGSSSVSTGIATAETTPPASTVPAPGSIGAGYFFAVIGDIPYGAQQVASFPGRIEQINAAQPTMTFHVGDIRDGSAPCDAAYFAGIRADFDRFDHPLIYTPGDNEWADCHHSSDHPYDPLERLAYLRSVFFPHPGTTLGHTPIQVDSQAAAGFPENVQLNRAGVDFAVLNVVGSSDDLQPWDGLQKTTATIEQTKEQAARMANAISVVHATFAAAREHHDRAVVILQQADMFPSSDHPAGSFKDSVFAPLVRNLFGEALTFSGPVYLINGDSHIYRNDQPFAAWSNWPAAYGIHNSTDNLERITVDGAGNNHDWLKMTVNPPGAASVLTWQQIPYTP